MKYIKVYTKIFKRVFLIAIIGAILILAACSSDTEIIPQDLTLDDVPVVTLPPVEKEPVPAIGGELVFAMPDNPASINPLKSNNVELTNLLSLIYEQPVRIDTDGKAVAELAEVWSVDSTGTVWTFKLREGVVWQNGNGNFTARDVIYTIDQIMSYSITESLYAIYNSSITSYDDTNEYTVTITLSEPSNIAVYFMTMPILCEAYMTNNDVDTSLPIGTGPYVATEYEPNTGMELVSNEVWWKEPPYIQKLSAICYSNHDTELVALDANMLDFVTTSTIAIEPYIKYKQTESIDYITQYYDCLVPNVTQGKLSDINIRQAIAYALDKRDIISDGLLGHAVATDYPIPLGSFLFGGASNIYEFNLQKAIELLGESGWKNRDEDDVFESVQGSLLSDLEINLLIYKNNEDTYRRDVADSIAAQLINCGILINIEEVSYDEYIRRLGAKEFDIALCSFYLDKNPDPTFMIGTNGSSNYGGFSDQNMDDLLQVCKTAATDEQMALAYLNMENYFVEQLPQIGLYFRTHSLIYDSTITIGSDLKDLSVYTTIPTWYIFVEEE